MGKKRRLVVTIVAALAVAVLIATAIAGAVTSTVINPEPQPSVTMVTDPVEQQKILDSAYKPTEEIDSAIQAQDFDKAITLLKEDAVNYGSDDSKSLNIQQLIQILETQKVSTGGNVPTPGESLDPTGLPGTGNE